MATYSRVLGTGSYLPETVLTNQELEKIVETSDEWIMQRVGIRERHLIKEDGSDDTTTSMAEKAARAAIEAAGIEANTIDLIVVGTATADYFFPSVACELQHRLGINNECPAFDLNAACSGFVYGISVADQYIRTGSAKTVLVIGVDALSRVVDWDDRSTCVLFGDGAGAVVLQASGEPGILATQLRSAGSYGDKLCTESSLWTREGTPKLHMEGREVFRQAVTKLDEIVEQTLDAAGLEKSAIDWLVPHQANIRIIQATAKRLKLPMERVILTIEKHGNTSAASIPLAFDYAVRQGTVKRGEVLMFEAFGAGLAWGAALLRY